MEDVFVGSGGASPGLTRFGDRSRITLAEGDSVYAVDVSLEGDVLAFGTRTGAVHVLAGIDAGSNGVSSWSSPTTGTANRTLRPPQFRHGKPVLSLCWLNESSLAVSDASGRCLLWDLSAENALARELPTGNGVIAALRRIDESNLAGLSSLGELFFWQLPAGELAKVVSVLPPPPISGLVQLMRLAERDALVFPGRDGQLVFYDTGEDRIQKLEAHRGDFYAMSILGEKFVTVGVDDGLLKVWETNSGKLNQQLQVPKGTVSAAALTRHSDSILLVNKTGSAGVFTLHNGRLEQTHTIPGAHYRVAVVCDGATMEEIASRRAETLARRITTAIENNPSDSVDDDHALLIEAGFKHVSLRLRAMQCQRNDDLASEVVILSELEEMLPDDARSCESLARYACLLEEIGQLEEARRVYLRIYSISGDQHASSRLEHLPERADVTTGIIKPDQSLETCIEAAEALKIPVSGRFLIKDEDVIGWRGVTFTADSIADKYEKVRSESRKQLPPAELRQTCLISKGRVEPVETIEFAGDGRIAFVLQLAEADFSTIVTPLVVFDASASASQASSGGHNRCVAESLKLSTSPVSRAWLDHLRGVVKQTLQRLINEAGATDCL